MTKTEFLAIPAGMRQVTKDEFFGAIGPLDAHPHPHKTHSSWETKSRRVVGLSWPGYMCEGPTGYALAATGEA